MKVSADLITTATYAPGLTSLQISVGLIFENYTNNFLPTGVYKIRFTDNEDNWAGNQVIFYGVSINVTKDGNLITFDPVSDEWGDILFPSKAVTGFLLTPVLIFVFGSFQLLVLVHHKKKE